MFVGGRLVLPRLFAQAARTKNPELFLAISLLTVILASMATAAAGLSPIVGALIAGLLIAETEYRAEVELTTAPLRGLALGVFLITIGMSLDLRMILAELAGAGGGHRRGGAGEGGRDLRRCCKFAGIRNGVAAETGVLMASPSETTLIVLGTAAQMALIAPDDRELLADRHRDRPDHHAAARPARPAGRALDRGGTRRWARARSWRRPAGHRAPAPAIIGFGRVGRMVADMLTVHGKPYIAVEADIDAVKAARADGYPVIFGDVARLRSWSTGSALGHADALILTMDDPVLTVQLTRRLRGWVPGLTIVARARDAAHAAELYRAGVTDAVPETLESSLQLSEAVLVDLGVAMGPVIASIHEKRDELRKEIKSAADMERLPRLRRARKADL